MFRSKFNIWPQTTDVTVSEDGRGKVAGLVPKNMFLYLLPLFLVLLSFWTSKFLSCIFLFDLTALLKRQGLNVKGLMKAAPPKEEPQPYIDCTGNLQVLFWFFFVFPHWYTLFCSCCWVSSFKCIIGWTLLFTIPKLMSFKWLMQSNMHIRLELKKFQRNYICMKSIVLYFKEKSQSIHNRSE